MRRFLLALFAFAMIGCAHAVSAATLTVCTSGCNYSLTNLQAAIDAAKCGDTIAIQDGASIRGQFLLPSKNPCTTYTTLTRMGALPSVYDVIPGCYQQGPTFAAEATKKATCKAELKARYESNAPKIYVDNAMALQGTAVALTFAYDADYWKITGLEISSTSTLLDPPVYALIAIGSNGREGNTLANRADLVPNHIVLDRISIHGNSSGSARRAILGNGDSVQFINSLCYEFHETYQDSQCFMAWNGVGPFQIENNFLEAAGENVLFGGADPVIVGRIPSDIVQTRNYMSKDVSWWRHADRVGQGWNGLVWSMKNLTECKNCQRNRIFGNVLENSWEANQNGGIVLFQAVADGPVCTWCTVKDIEVSGNVMRHASMGVVIGGRGGQNNGATMGANINVHDNLMYDISLRYSDNGTNYAQCFMFVSGSASSYNPPVEHGSLNGISFNHNTCDNEGNFGSLLNQGDRFGQLTITNNLGRGRYNFAVIAIACGCNAGTEGFNIMAPGSYNVANNAFATLGVEVAWPANNWFIASGNPNALALWSAVFVNRSAADYRLVAGSPYKAGGSQQSTDGKDLGVDMTLLLAGSSSTAPKGPGTPTGVRILP
jgi:hypothetical protein